MNGTSVAVIAALGEPPHHDCQSAVETSGLESRVVRILRGGSGRCRATVREQRLCESTSGRNDTRRGARGNRVGDGQCAPCHPHISESSDRRVARDRAWTSAGDACGDGRALPVRAGRPWWSWRREHQAAGRCRDDHRRVDRSLRDYSCRYRSALRTDAGRHRRARGRGAATGTRGSRRTAHAVSHGPQRGLGTGRYGRIHPVAATAVRRTPVSQGPYRKSRGPATAASTRRRGAAHHDRTETASPGHHPHLHRARPCRYLRLGDLRAPSVSVHTPVGRGDAQLPAGATRQLCQQFYQRTPQPVLGTPHCPGHKVCLAALGAPVRLRCARADRASRGCIQTLQRPPAG